MTPTGERAAACSDSVRVTFLDGPNRIRAVQGLGAHCVPQPWSTQGGATLQLGSTLMFGSPAAALPTDDTTTWSALADPSWRVGRKPRHTQSAPPHHHPGPGIGYVIEGTFDSAFADEPMQHVGAGQSFVIPTFELDEPRVQLEPGAKSPVVGRDALHPETVEADARTRRLLVSSVREGAVYAIGLDSGFRASEQGRLGERGGHGIKAVSFERCGR